jgi:hypothetical protein
MILDAHARGWRLGAGKQGQAIEEEDSRSGTNSYSRLTAPTIPRSTLANCSHVNPNLRGALSTDHQIDNASRVNGKLFCARPFGLHTNHTNLPPGGEIHPFHNRGH